MRQKIKMPINKGDIKMLRHGDKKYMNQIVWFHRRKGVGVSLRAFLKKIILPKIIISNQTLIIFRTLTQMKGKRFLQIALASPMPIFPKFSVQGIGLIKLMARAFMISSLYDYDLHREYRPFLHQTKAKCIIWPFPSSVLAVNRLLTLKTTLFLMFYNNQMKFKERDASSKRKYSKISICKRKKLIDSVVHQGESLIKTTKKLNINLSTARLIIKLYKSTGSFYMKNFKHPPKEDQNQQIPKQSMEIRQDNEEDEIQNQEVQGSKKEENSDKEERTEDAVAGGCQFYWYYVPYYFGM